MKPLRKFGSIALATLAAICGVTAGTSARGEEYNFVPSLAVKEEYTDNVFFSSGAKESAFITIVSPRLEGVLRNERTDGSLSVGIDEFIYSQNKIITALNMNAKGNLTYQVDPLLTVSVNSGYYRNNRPDRELEQNGQVINSTRRDRQVYGASAEYRLTERTVTGVSYSYNQEDYQNQAISNNSSQVAGIGLVHDLGQIIVPLSLRSNLGFADYHLADSQTYNYTATGGVSLKLSEIMDLTVDVGGRYTRMASDFIDFDPNQGIYFLNHDTSNSWGWVGKSTLLLRGEVNSGSMTIGHDVGLASSRRGTSQNDTVNFDYRHNLTPDLRGSISFGYQKSKSDSKTVASHSIDDDYYNVGAAIHYDVTRNFAIDGGYYFTKAVYHETNTSADKNSLVVTVSYKHPLFD